jgi:hypothetical protein
MFPSFPESYGSRKGLPPFPSDTLSLSTLSPEWIATPFS